MASSAEAKIVFSTEELFFEKLLNGSKMKDLVKATNFV